MGDDVLDGPGTSDAGFLHAILADLGKEGSPRFVL
jgi:hypothetical protein